MWNINPKQGNLTDNNYHLGFVLVKKVLLIDDDKALQHRVKHALEAEGFDVSLAVNDINTLAEKASLAVDMIILDFNAAMSDSIDILKKKILLCTCDPLFPPLTPNRRGSKPSSMMRMIF